MMLALAAERTTTIGLGPGVLRPHLRHPMVNASATAALEALAPGRSRSHSAPASPAPARSAPPRPAGRFSRTTSRIPGLLGGAIVQWRGTRMQMLHPPGHAPQRPIEVPVLISALGPKGINVAIEHADGLFTVNGETRYAPQFAWAALGVHGTVLADGEPLDSPRVQAAAGRETRWPTTPHTNSAATSPHSPPATCGSRPSTKPRRRNATSRCTTSTSSP